MGSYCPHYTDKQQPTYLFFPTKVQRKTRRKIVYLFLKKKIPCLTASTEIQKNIDYLKNKNKHITKREYPKHNCSLIIIVLNLHSVVTLIH